MINKTVYFTGTLPQKGETPFGGGEVGNVRTIKMLESFGYNTVIVRRSRSNAKDSVIKRKLEYPFRTISNVLKWFFVLLFGTRENGIAHISGFYGETIYVETIQAFVAKLLGYKMVYELRGGGATEYFENGSRLYKAQFRYILNKASYLLSQGRENEPLLHSLCNAPVFYYPNCVQRGFYPEEIPIRTIKKINLLFFGRIEPDKNPLLIVSAASLLQKMFNNITLTILGNGEKELVKQIKVLMQETLIPGSYQLLPGCAHEELQQVFADKHFYIFPSQQKREGQSNAVTEAMSYGIIPIASPQGFNCSTIGDDKLIVYDMTPEAFAERIAAIIRNGEIEKYSQFVRQRFMENYTERVVFEKTKEYFKEILG